MCAPTWAKTKYPYWPYKMIRWTHSDLQNSAASTIREFIHFPNFTLIITCFIASFVAWAIRESTCLKHFYGVLLGGGTAWVAMSKCDIPTLVLLALLAIWVFIEGNPDEDTKDENTKNPLRAENKKPAPNSLTWLVSFLFGWGCCVLAIKINIEATSVWGLTPGGGSS